MSYSIKTIPTFLRQAKRLTRKYPSFKNDLANLITSLESDPKQGIMIKENCFKIRLAIKSKGKGKSGGARVITYLIDDKLEVFLLSVYDKGDKDNIQDHEIDALISEIPEDDE